MKYSLLILTIVVCFGCGEINYDNLFVGNQYHLCAPEINMYDKNDPFAKPVEPMRPEAYVIIVAKKDGWIQYCQSYEVKDTDRLLFTRTSKDFIEMIEYCKKINQ